MEQQNREWSKVKLLLVAGWVALATFLIGYSMGIYVEKHTWHPKYGISLPNGNWYCSVSNESKDSTCLKDVGAGMSMGINAPNEEGIYDMEVKFIKKNK